MSLYLKVIFGFPSFSLAMSFHEKSPHWIKILSQRRSTYSVYTVLVQTIKNYTTVLRQHSYIQLYDITLITTFTGGQIDIKKRIVSWKLFFVYKSPFQLGLWWQNRAYYSIGKTSSYVAFYSYLRHFPL